MKLFWTPESIEDRRAIYDYIEADNPLAAIELDELIFEKSQILTAHPKLGRIGRVSETRELIVHANYILIYAIAGREIHILRVVHAARQWPPRPK
jgi:toxin ParE1/3/4